MEQQSLAIPVSIMMKGVVTNLDHDHSTDSSWGMIIKIMGKHFIKGV